MTSKVEWLEQNELLGQGFKNAIELTEELEEELAEHISLSEELAILKEQEKSWQNHRFEMVVIGEFSTGKSTFINALLGKNVLPSKVTPTTATINFIRHINDGPKKEVAVVNYNDGRIEEVAFDQLDEYVTEMSKNVEVSTEIHHVDLFIDSPYLQDGVIIVDTPGLQALHEEHEKITKRQIKQSHASIFLLNMEQLGKKTEFELLRDVKSSIDRIFFIGNRLDSIPVNEIQEVVDSFEDHLMNNDYQEISREQARLYPVSALQALKARDHTVKTKHWNEMTSDELLRESRFTEFENQLEEYLFDGEKAQDALDAPRNAISKHYERIIHRLEEFQTVLSGTVDVEALEEEQDQLNQAIELRKLQLEEKVRRIENLFDDAVLDNQKWFEEKFNYIEQDLEKTIQDAESVEELQNDIQYEWANFYRRYDDIVEDSIEELIGNLNYVFNQEIESLEILELKASEISMDVSQKELSITQVSSGSVASNIKERVHEEFKEAEEELTQNAKVLKQVENKSREIARKERQIERQQMSDEQESRFQREFLNNVPQMKKELRVVKKRWLLPDKKELMDVENDQYLELYHNLRQTNREQQKARIESESVLDELEDEKNELETDLMISSRDEIRERKREIRQQKQERILEEMTLENKRKKRELDKERRRLKRQIENELIMHKREYRQLLRSMDTLKVAKLRIAQYVEEADQELEKQQQYLKERAQLLKHSQTEQEKVTEIINDIQTKMIIEQANLY